MLTFRFKTKKGYDVSKICYDYSGMFREMYVNFCMNESLANCHTFENYIRKKYGFDSWFYTSCRVDVKTKIAQQETNDEKNKVLLEQLENRLKNEEFEGIQAEREKYYITEKIRNLKNAIGRDITFGTRELAKRIRFLSNPVSKKVLKDKTPEKIEKLESERIANLAAAKEEYEANRILAVYSVGEAPHKSNRKFDFDFPNKKVIFKPDKNTKIPIEFYCGKKQFKKLMKLHDKIGEMPLSVRLENDYIHISYDEEFLAGFAFEENEYFRELKTIPKENKAYRKELYVGWKEEQKRRKMVGKIPERILSMDKNPQYLGFSILEKQPDNSMKTIAAKCFDLTGLNTQLKLSSSDPVQVKQNNKRKFELNEAMKYMFKMAVHYQVAHFGNDDVSFKDTGVNTSSAEASRQIKNLWNRTQTDGQIVKRCNELGIIHVPVNTAYTSFIGNIQNNYYDPVNASMEICRRGILKYEKGTFYPEVQESDVDHMFQLAQDNEKALKELDVLRSTGMTWVKAYATFSTAGLRYRGELKNFIGTNLKKKSSGVKIYHFATI